MDFSLTEEQLMLQRTVRDLLQKECTKDVLAKGWEDESYFPKDVWGSLADVGVFSIMVPESDGGLGLGCTEMSLILLEAGEVALPCPLLESTMIGLPLIEPITKDDRKKEWTQMVCDGKGVVGFGLTPNEPISFANHVNILLVQENDFLYACQPTKDQLQRVESVDRNRKLFQLDWPNVKKEVISAGQHVVRQMTLARMRGALGTSALLLGLSRAVLNQTVDYVKQRHQFSRPIGSFQAVKHQLSNARIELEFALPNLYRGAIALDEQESQASLYVGLAKYSAIHAARLCARTALQAHGAIGYTTEYALHYWLKRIWCLTAAWGDVTYCENQMAQNILGT